MTKPAPIREIDVAKINFNISETYRLSFIRGNVQQYQFLQFNEDLNIMELVKVAKRYCERTGNRFVHLDRAVFLIDVATGEPIQDA